jgi:ADP-ribose pyrophosphatase YjhB (NUDIX family)
VVKSTSEKMIIDEVKKNLKEPLRQATLCFLVKEDKILLAMKKRGFAAGKWNGAGGKPNNEDKNIEATAKRETLEEIQVTVRKLKKVAILNFYFQVKTDWNQQVTVFLTNTWQGEPKETEEMAPKWFNLNEIPYDKMWEDDILWLPLVLKGNIVKADFLFDENQKMLEHNVRELA